MNFVGIDVSQKELAVVVSINGKARSVKIFENTTSGHQALIHRLLQLKGETRICLEATGVYHFDCAVALSRTVGLEVMVINPKAAHNFAQALIPTGHK
jgi:transposase